MEKLSEGQRQAGAVKIYTDALLNVALGQQEADIVVTSQGEYQVEVAERWENGLIPHNAYVCTRIV
jgi:hypothetical protein